MGLKPFRERLSVVLVLTQIVSKYHLAGMSQNTRTSGWGKGNTSSAQVKPKGRFSELSIAHPKVARNHTFWGQISGFFSQEIHKAIAHPYLRKLASTFLAKCAALHFWFAAFGIGVYGCF
jgi:hypothetical protein